MIPDLSKCGIDLDIIDLDLANKKIEEAMKKLSEAQGGIADNIANLKTQLEADFGEALAKLDKLVPEFPELPPNLQAEFAKLVGALNDPLALAAQVANIEKLFGAAPGVDLNTLLGDLGSLASIDICKAIPNIDVKEVPAIDGTVTYQYTVKGLPPKAPVKDAVEPPAPPEPKKPETVTPKPTQQVVPVKKPEAKKEAPTRLPPAQPALAPPAETISVAHSIHWLNLVDAMANADMPTPDWTRRDRIFTKTVTDESWGEGSKAFWKPNGYLNQLSLEVSYVTIAYTVYKRAKSNIRFLKKRKAEDPNYKPSKDVDAMFDEDKQKALVRATLKFVRAGSDTKVGKDYSFSFKRAPGGKKIIGVTVSVEQAKRSVVPKPPTGDWGTYSILAE